PFVGWDWHIKDALRSDVLQEAMSFSSRWRMPLVFFVAGAGVMLALGRRGAGEFARERLLRLGLPLVFSILVVVPPQVYLERVAEGDFAGSLAAFYPHFFEGVYPQGNFSWHHLWYLAYALALTLMLLPAFLWLRTPRGRAAVEAAVARAGAPALMLAAVLPLALANILLRRISFADNALVGDWYGLATYGLAMLYGAVLYGSPALLASAERGRWGWLALGAAGYAVYRGLVLPELWDVQASEPAFALWSLVKAANALGVVLALAGFARRHLTRGGPWLRYAAEAVFPFYILHQTVTVVLAFHLRDADLPLAVKYLACAGLTFLVSLALYEGVVRRLGPGRLLFGLKREPAGPTLAQLLAGAGKPAAATAG
ncbi:MAG TPA: acyltransferase family protein, partial [Azospirillaceae bacterium]|nr:acyltransferase family protein [Azospirillaceae bacterium]